MKIKQRPEDFSVIESYRFEEVPRGEYYVYRLDKQKLTTLDAVERIRLRFKVKRRDISFCGLKDKQGRTEQLIAVKGRLVELQEPDLRLTLIGRTNEPLSARNITSNRFSVIVRDLSEEECEVLPEALAEVERVGVINYFDSQRFGFVKHGQGFIAKDILRGDHQSALRALLAQPSELDRSGDKVAKRWFAENWGEWEKTPPKGHAAKYMPILLHLREHPSDFGGALLKLDARLRAMIVFEFQSAIWNESVRRWLKARFEGRDLIGLRYQLGVLDFPTSLPKELTKGWKKRTFPLLAPETTFSDPEVEAACRAVLEKEKLTLEKLRAPKIEAFHFKHEERPLVVFPGALRVSAPKPDEENQGRLKVVLSFTLPPGAYASLVVRRVFWRALPENEALAPPKKKRTPEAEGSLSEETKVAPKGFREKQREKKEAKAAARAQAVSEPESEEKKPRKRPRR